MKFKTKDELLKFLINEDTNDNLKDIDITFNYIDEVSESLEIPEAPSVPPCKAQLSALHESPSVDIHYGDENVLYVDAIQSIKNACGYGKISMMGKDIMLGLCESDGNKH